MKKIIMLILLMTGNVLADIGTTETNSYTFTKSLTANTITGTTSITSTGAGFIGNGTSLTNLNGLNITNLTTICTLGITNTTYLPNVESVIPMGVVVRDTFGGANTANSRIDLNKTGLWYFASTYSVTASYGSSINVLSYIYIIENSVGKTNYLYNNKYQVTGLTSGPYSSVNGYWMVTSTNAQIKVATDPGVAPTGFGVYKVQLTAIYIGP